MLGVVDESGEQVADLVAGERDQPWWGRVSARAVAVMTARNAWASMARMVQRCHEVQRRTWCSSSPVNPLPAWKDSSIVHRRPATATRVASGTGVGV